VFKAVLRGAEVPDNAEALIIGQAEKPDEPKYWVLVHRQGEVLGFYRVNYEIWGRYADVVSDETARLRCPKCGARVTRVEIHRDVYALCERSHLTFLGILVGRIIGYEAPHQSDQSRE